MELKEYLPLGFWSFNGDMDHNRIEEQVYQLYSQKFGGFFIHARGGLTIEYMSKEWFAACSTAVSVAEKLGLSVWLYDEDGWPSGFAGGAVNGLGESYQAKHFKFSTTNTTKDNLVAVFRKKGNEYFMIAPEKARKGDLFCHYELVPNYVDLLNPQVTKTFIQLVHERYALHFGDKFGKTIKGIFTDEPQLVYSAPYSESIFDLYMEHYKEDLHEVLWLLYVDGNGYQKVRCRYWSIVGELFNNNFTKPIADWCEKHHIEMTGHFGNEDGLCEQVRGNGDLLSHYSKMQRPGIDHLGRRLASPVLPKQVADAADICGQKMVLSESFGCCGWDVSFPELNWIAGWQGVFGVNNIVNHLVAYTIEGRRKRDYPAFFSDQEPWWNQYKNVNETIAFYNEKLSNAERQSDILLLQPLNGMWCESSICSDPANKARNISNQYRMTVENLIDLQIDFSIVNDELMNRFELDSGFFKLNERKYHTVIVSQTESLHRETWEKLYQFEQNGGKIIFVNDLPALLDGEESSEFEKQLHSIEKTVICNRRNLWEKYFIFSNYERKVSVLSPREEKITTGLVTNIRSTNNGYLACVFNPSVDDIKNAFISFDYVGKVTLLHSNGSSEILPTVPSKNDGTLCKIEVAPMQLMLLLIEKTKDYYLPEEKISSIIYPNKWDVKIDSLNTITIDRCDIYLNNSKYFTNILPIKKMDEIYQKIFLMQKDVEVKAVYYFYNDIKDINGKMFLAAETKSIQKVIINGRDITDTIFDSWIDPSILMYSVGELLENGLNKVELIFTVPRLKELKSCVDCFETETNRFYYDVELESIYLIGDFDVDSNCFVVKSENLLLTGNSNIDSFFIKKSEPKYYGELTSQGLWFYRGNVLFETLIQYESSKKTILHIGKMNGSLIGVEINGKNIAYLTEAPLSVEISKYLKQGENSLTLKLFGTNRNLLGPHHHIKGNLNFVGPENFEGVLGWEDFINPEIKEDTFTDTFSFVPFGIDNVSITTYD